MANILVIDNVYQGTSSACITDITPPTFAGVSSVSVQSRGQIRTTWSAATDTTPPVRYEIYIKVGTSSGLFNTINICGITDKLLFDTWTTPDGQFLVNGTTYYLGVRAVDAVGNRDSNLISQSVISTGVFVSADVYEADGAFAINASNQFQGTIWCLKNSTLATSSNATMGTASYTVFDKNGTAVPGMSGSGIVADVNGQYKISTVANSLSESLEHYMVQVVTNVDGANRTGYVPLIQKAPIYDISGVFFVDTSNNFDGSFWVSRNENIYTTGLGTASYQVYDADGSPVVGMSQAGISADVNGVYKITPVTSLLGNQFTGYSVRITVTVDSVQRVEMLAIQGKIPEYESHGQFSINALNNFQATLWATVDGVVKKGIGLGTASYTVYDSAGVAVAGMTQSGIVADANGRFQITPVSAALLTDLTHYSVKIAINVDGQERESFKGFTLLGT